MNWFLVAMKKYAVFSGRAHRREYWLFVLVAVLIAVALITMDIATGTYDKEAGLGILSGVFFIATLVPSVAAGVRRLHDTGRSGWWWLLVLVPLVGGIVLLVLCAQPGEQGENQYGPDPLAAA